MKIKLITVGKLKEKYLKDACDEYIKRLNRFTQLQIIEIKEEKYDSESKALISSALEKEGQAILEKVNAEDYKILLDLAGEELSSEEVANLFQTNMSKRNSSYAIIVGGSHGVSDEVKAKSDYLLKLSSLTFPHQIVRLLILEMLFRSFKIIRGEKYHK